MSLQTIPVNSAPGQVFGVSVTINGLVQSFNCTVTFNEVAQYWVLNIYQTNNVPIILGLPMVTGLNLLRQYQYLGIGSIYVLNVTGVPIDSPNATDLGVDFQLLWGDNTQVPVAA
jgi:hypothetical protein